MNRNQRRKKTKPQKTLEDRKIFYEKIKNKFLQIGLWSDQYPGVKLFQEILDKYVVSGEHQQGKIELPEFKRTIAYILTNHKLIEPTVHLLHTP